MVDIARALSAAASRYKSRRKTHRCVRVVAVFREGARRDPIKRVNLSGAKGNGRSEVTRLSLCAARVAGAIYV